MRIKTAIGSRATGRFYALVLLLVPFLTWAEPQTRVILITIDGLAASYLRDTQAPLPTLRRLAAEGAVGQALRVCNPSTTWPNHTTLVTGVPPAKHSVLFNGKLIRGGPGEPVKLEGTHNKSDLVAIPTIYDQVHRAGGRVAAINWPCTRGAETLHDNFPDGLDRVSATTPRLRAELIHAGLLEDASDATFLKKNTAAADQVWTGAALHLLHNRPPQLLLLHLLGTDDIQHRYGPNSPATYTALALADAFVGEIVHALDKAGFREQTAVLVVSDHGFAQPLTLVNPNVVFRKAGLQRPGRRRAESLSHGGTAFVYLTQPETAREDGARVTELLQKVEGIAAILGPDRFAALGLPEPAQNPQMGDLLLVANRGYAFMDDALEDEVITALTVPLGSHGYLSTDSRMDGVLVAWGHRIKPGAKLSSVDIQDVAPTVGALLGVPLPDAQGKVLTEILLPERISE